MCGHVGMAGDLEHKDEAAFRRLLLFDWLRGQDSTGMACVDNKYEATVVKAATHPINLFDMAKFKSALTGYNSRVLLGHNRAATLGKVNDVNAHPFQFDHIVGAHNGTLDQASWDRLTDRLGHKTGTDSEAIIESIAKFGVEKTISLMESGSTSAKGAWALVWIDSEDQTLNFLRNKHRPMWFAYTEDHKKIIWASEWPFIHAATALAPQTAGYKLSTKDNYQYFSMDEDVWYKYDLEALKAGGKNRPKPKVKTLKGRDPLPVAQYNYNGAARSPFPAGSGTQSGRTTTNGSNSGHSRGRNNDNVVPDVITAKGSSAHPLSIWMSEERFNHLAKYGCSFCQADIDYNEPGVTVYENREIILCPTCSGNDHNRLYVDSDQMQDIHAMSKTFN